MSIVNSYDLILRRGRSVDGQLLDIAVQAGKIALVGTVPSTASAQVEHDLQGQVYVSAGWIDLHVHCYPHSPIYNDEPDKVGIACGVTTVVDAGSAGADDIDDFYRLTRQAKTEVKALLNVSRIGLLRQNELAQLDDINEQAAHSAITQNPDFIVGLKARMSSSVVEHNGITPLLMAKKIQRQHPHLPLMVHVGNNPPTLDDIADLLDKGDIITHCYNGKPNRILNTQGQLKSSVQQALERGVHLDVGHGSASFSFAVAEQAIAQGILPHTISSDIYCRNRIQGPVFGLAHILSKFLAIGLTLPQVIACVTEHAAGVLHFDQKGALKVGFDADLTLFELLEQPSFFVDAEQQQKLGAVRIAPVAAVRAGEIFITEEGEAHDVFCL